MRNSGGGLGTAFKRSGLFGNASLDAEVALMPLLEPQNGNLVGRELDSYTRVRRTLFAPSRLSGVALQSSLLLPVVSPSAIIQEQQRRQRPTPPRGNPEGNQPSDEGSN